MYQMPLDRNVVFVVDEGVNLEVRSMICQLSKSLS